MFELFIACIMLHATSFCDGDTECVQIVRECTLDEGSFNFCTEFEYNRIYALDNVCEKERSMI